MVNLKKITLKEVVSMSAYAVPIYMAVLLFPIITGLLVLPYAIYQYRKYGSISKLKLLVIFSFIFYLLCAYFLIILPMPTREEVAKLTTPRYNLVPFNVVRYFLNTTVLNIFQPSTYLPALRQGAFLQPFFNLVLTIPFGVYLRYIWKLPLKKVVLASFGLSLFFELTQLTGLYFIYPRSYRLFDVDDLILNTSGGALGYALAPMLTRFFPSYERLNEAERQDRYLVSFWRRLAALLVDWLVVNGVLIGLAFAGLSIDFSHYLVYLSGVFLYFVVLPYFWQGTTVGKRLVKIRLVQADGSKVRFLSLLLRQFLLFGIVIALGYDVIPRLLELIAAGTAPRLEIYTALLVISSFFALCFLIDIVMLIWKRDPMFYEKASHTKEIAE